MKLDKNYKVRVTPEQSREIHSLILLDGGEVSYGLKPQPQDEFLVIENEHGSVVIYYTDQDIFLSAEQQEIQADDLITMLTNLSKSDMEIDTTQNSVDNNQANTQDNSANIQDSRVNIQAPHVSSPSNDGATYVSEPCNDLLFPRFEVGQKAYCPWLNDGELVTLGLDDNGDLIAQTKKGLQAFDCEGYALDCTPRQPDLFPATDYYFEHLSAIMPWIEFEQPLKELTGSDIARALIKKGWIGFNCLCGNSGDGDAITDTIVTGINNGGQFTTIDGRLFNNAIPMKGWRPLKAQEAGL